MSENERKKLKTGVKTGGGPSPGYEWNIDLIDLVVKEGRDVLGEIGYDHMSHQFRELARNEDPRRSDIVDVRSLGDGADKIYEIRDKGTVFGGANVRVLFGVHPRRRTIVPLASFKKQNNGPTPKPDLIKARRRWRLYQTGEFGLPFPD